MNSVRILDCTLRDGGCVNDFNFGTAYMNAIKTALEDAGIDIIECGYIDEHNGSLEKRTQFIDDKAVKDQFLCKKKSNTMYVAMIDYGKFNCQNLEPCTDEGLDGIRLAFHKKDRNKILKTCNQILDKGYKLFIQPMTVLRYSDQEILELVNLVNTELPDVEAFYIVDSFGEMYIDDLKRIVSLIDHNLNKDISLGLHSHNNLQMSYSNACCFLEFKTSRDKVIDASIMGMGKGAGNLNTELFLELMVQRYSQRYNIYPLLDVMDKVLKQIYADHRWGYSAEYYLSAKNSCTSSYAKHFYEKHPLSIAQIDVLLGMLKEEKKVSFDKEYAEQVYFEYNNIQIDDQRNFDKLKSIIGLRRVLLIAPGHSINKEKDRIHSLLQEEDVFSIMLNMTEIFRVDYVFANKTFVFEQAKRNNQSVLAFSNMGSGTDQDIILDYGKWIRNSSLQIESSLQSVMNILSHIGVKNILLAGFDGFGVDINQNYYTQGLARNLPPSQIQEMNKKNRDILDYYRNIIHIDFVTPSQYEISL